MVYSCLVFIAREIGLQVFIAKESGLQLFIARESTDYLVLNIE